MMTSPRQLSARAWLPAAAALGAFTWASDAFAASPGDAHGFPWLHLLGAAINFIIFMGIILKLAGSKISAYFQKRQALIRFNLDEAKRLREEAEAKLAQYVTRLGALEAERQALLEEYHQQGLREKERIIQEANRQAEKMKADAEVMIAQEVKKARADLEREAVDNALNLAKQMARESLSARAEQSRLVDGYIKDLDKVTRLGERAA